MLLTKISFINFNFDEIHIIFNFIIKYFPNYIFDFQKVWVCISSPINITKMFKTFIL